MTLSKDSAKREESLRNIREAAQKRVRDPEWIRKNKEGALNKNKDFYKDPEWIRKNKERAQKCAQDPEYRRKQKKGCQKCVQDPEWQRKQKEGSKRRSQDSEWQRKNKEENLRKSHDPNWRLKNQKSAQVRVQNLKWQLKQQESKVGGFWYGNVRYSDPPKYCELWCPDLWRRIDEAQDYQSILSGKTKEDNGGRSLSRHHVYYQKKACCEWDEDANGYYAWINDGTPKKPNRVKYYIPGDPNKFVLLTMSEHRVVAKDKLKWIKIFENLIEMELGGVCYISK